MARKTTSHLRCVCACGGLSTLLTVRCRTFISVLCGRNLANQSLLLRYVCWFVKECKQVRVNVNAVPSSVEVIRSAAMAGGGNI